MIYWAETESSVGGVPPDKGTDVMRTSNPVASLHNQSFSTEYLQSIVDRGLPMYAALDADLLKRHQGEYVLINVETGEMVFGETELDASDTFVEKFGEQAPGFLQLIE